MLNPDEIIRASARRWPSVLRAEAAGQNAFPLNIPFGKPHPTDDFATLRTEIELLACARCRWSIEWEQIETRRWGQQRWPVRLQYDSIEDLATTIGKGEDLKLFRIALRDARTKCPMLEPWLLRSAHRIIDHLTDWQGLVDVCAYFSEHPRPDCYPRQIPVSVGTKFIEEHEAILRELLDVVLGDLIDPVASTFAGRFHLRLEPAQVRFRFLDSSLREQLGWPVFDCTIAAPVFAAFDWNIPRVIIVENRDVFLCLPELPGTLAVFGSGKASVVLKDGGWLRYSELLYWGDCDEAGFGILSNLRSHFPHIRSVLMDILAWKEWQHLAIPGKRDLSAKHSCLTDGERTALGAVIAGPWMLEQERIPPAAAARAILSAISFAGTA